MLRITLTERASGLTLSLEGKVSGPWVTELAQAWVQARERAAQAEITLDLRQVSFIDEPGRELLVRLHREGCRMVGSGAYVGPMVQAIQNGREAGWSPLRWCWMTALGMAAAAAAAAAPDPGPAPAPLSLTLPQAVRLGLDQNPDVHQALLAIAHSQEERRGAASALMPAVEASATGNRYKLNLDTLIGTATPGGPHVAGPYTYGSIGVQASAPLLDLSLWQRWKAAKDGELSAQARAKAARESIAALVAGQYLRAQRCAESLKAAQSRVQLAEALELLARNQQKEGLGTRLDTLRAQVQLQTERQRLIQARTQLQTSRFGLVKLLNLDPRTEVSLADTLAAPQLPTFTVQEALDASFRQRAELTALDARERSMEHLKEAAKALRLPSLVATASYASSGLAGQPWVPVNTLSVGLRVPLFTGGRISAETAKAKTEILRVQEERRALKAQVGLEVQVAQAELAAVKGEVEVASQARELAQEALEQARHRFEAGVSNNIEVINAQDELARATDNHINALHRLNQSRLDLARAMGQLEPLVLR